MRADAVARTGCVPGPDGWVLAPEGAAVHPVERTAVIADVHLGYEWARGAGGECIPAHSLAETLRKLSALLERVDVDLLVVAGDLVESPTFCRRTAADVRRLTDWLEARDVRMVALAGNHDPRQSPALPATQQIAGWTVSHGHRRIEAARSIRGHVHPILRAGSVSAPCFLVAPRQIILPAFTPNAAGWNVAAGFPQGVPRDRSLRCVAGAGEELLDFGPVATLATRLQSM